MNAILAIPMEVRLAALFVLGTALGSLVNLGIYRLAWNPRAISPWSSSPCPALPRRWSDRWPVIGWLRLRRETEFFGRGFWIRPMILEVATGLLVAGLYWWEVDRLALMPVVRPFLDPVILGVVHTQYAVHVLLLCFMTVGAVIDIDERIIPDAVTVTGTLMGLVLAACVPWSLLPYIDLGLIWAPRTVHNWPFVLRLTSPNPWPVWLDGRPHGGSLAIGLGCWWLWCVALMPRSWYGRHGWRRALALSTARLVRHPSTYRILVMGAVGSVGIGLIWVRAGLGWQGLLTGLVGMAVGGGLIWTVRVIGRAALRKEAMGFGDVTLMAMLGSYLGWQNCLVIFFLAPMAAVMVGIVQLVMRRGPEIPYGPFLCLAAAWTVANWDSVWDRVWPVFGMGGFVPAAIGVCMVLFGVMLGAWQWIRSMCQRWIRARRG